MSSVYHLAGALCLIVSVFLIVGGLTFLIYGHSRREAEVLLAVLGLCLGTYVVGPLSLHWMLDR